MALSLTWSFIGPCPGFSLPRWHLAITSAWLHLEPSFLQWTGPGLSITRIQLQNNVQTLHQPQHHQTSPEEGGQTTGRAFWEWKWVTYSRQQHTISKQISGAPGHSYRGLPLQLYSFVPKKDHTDCEGRENPSSVQAVRSFSVSISIRLFVLRLHCAAAEQKRLKVTGEKLHSLTYH